MNAASANRASERITFTLGTEKQFTRLNMCDIKFAKTLVCFLQTLLRTCHFVSVPHIVCRRYRRNTSSKCKTRRLLVHSRQQRELALSDFG